MSEHKHKWMWHCAAEDADDWYKVCECGTNGEPITDADYAELEALCDRMAIQEASRWN